NTFGLIKAVSDTIFDMIVTTYHDKPLIFSGATFKTRSANFSETSSEVRSVFTPLDPTFALIGKKPHFSLPDDGRRISPETLPR
ncbi:MAG: hypothetical protein AAGM67_12450, partial [Bacteroidota bacterium]